MLLASVSHDFRTPLTTVKALAEGLAQGAPSDGADAVRSAAGGISEQADRLLQLVENVLDLSRIRGGVLPMRAELNTAEDLVGAAVRHAQGVLAGRAIDYDIDWESPALTGHFDMSHALRALANLLENAAKYSPAGSPITIQVRREDGWLVIAVGDRGAGVAPEERERIFEEFYRPPGTSPDAGGTGLGLAIARRLAGAQSGTVTYAPRPGGGSFFALKLPADQVAVATDPRDEPAVASPRPGES